RRRQRRRRPGRPRRRDRRPADRPRRRRRHRVAGRDQPAPRPRMSAAPPEPSPPSTGLPANSISDRLPSREGYLGVSRSAIRWLEILGGIVAAIGIAVFGVIVVGFLEPGLADGDDPSDGAQLGIQAFL